MHGLIFAELKKFVVANFGGETWNKLLEEAGAGQGTIYMPNQVYTDEQLTKLVVAGSRLSGIPAPQLLESFGEFIAPELLRLYEAQLNPAWKTLDLVENTEKMVHRAVRVKVPGATPPMLATTRPQPNHVLMTYTSERRLCAVAVGIVRGVAKQKGETVQIGQPECMLNGDERCLIDIRVP